MNGLERWYFYHSPADIRIDVLIEDLREFCNVDVADIDGEEGIWLIDNSEDELRVFLSDTVCCTNSQQDNRITKTLSKHQVYLVPLQLDNETVYQFLTEITSNMDVVKIDYMTRDTKLLNQFQIQVNVSDFPAGLHLLPKLLSDRLGISKEFPIKTVHIVQQRVTLRSTYIEQPDSSNANGVLLEYLLGCKNLIV